jgi:hypothetical protein
MYKKKLLIASLVLVASGFSAVASAHDDARLGVYVSASVNVGPAYYSPAPVYYAAPAYYAPPRLVYNPTPVVVYRPHPVYVVRPAPVFYYPSYTHHHRHHHHHHHWED